jgi:RNA-directed DNA polymerase
MRGSREIPCPPVERVPLDAEGSSMDAKPRMHGHGESDSCVVPEKSPNKEGQLTAEATEGRQLAKRNSQEGDQSRTQCREVDLTAALMRVREAARRNKEVRFTAIFHHIVEVERLEQAFWATRRDAASGIDGMTWEQYGQDLDRNLRGLAERLRKGAYQPKPVRRVFIPKADGRQRPLGIPALEDKIVQRAAVEVLNGIYEQDFVGFSYGFRPGRSQHNALDALSVALTYRKVNWVLDADIRGFFDNLSQEWLMKFLEHRIADQRVLRLIRKWLKAGVMEDGKHIESELGTVQGGSISPLLANVYLHYVFDLWMRSHRKRARGGVVVVRYADDFVIGVQYRDEAEQLLRELRERFAKFQLELHPEKTRLIEFGRFAESNRRERNEGKPETFSFLGFTHICGKTRKGWFTVLRQTMRKKMMAKLTALKQELRQRWHQPIREQGKYLQAVLDGHYRYYGVPQNRDALRSFHNAVVRLWWRTLQRRSQRPLQWNRLLDLARRWLPEPRIYHPYPNERLRVST